MVDWNELNQKGYISPIKGIDAVTIQQIVQYSGISKKILTVSRTKIKKDLEALGMFNAKIKDILPKVDAIQKDSCTYSLRLEDDNYTDVSCGIYCYHTAPAVARLIDFTITRNVTMRNDGLDENCCTHASTLNGDVSLSKLVEIKTVQFLGSELIAARDNDGQIWAGVRWMCEGIGLSEGQLKAERLKIQSDKVLVKGGRNFVLPTKGGLQETLCLKLDFVPLWLAKINITHTMESETPELADRLEQYQLRAKDILAESFLTQHTKDNSEHLSTMLGKLNTIESRISNIERKISYTNSIAHLHTNYNQEWLDQIMPSVRLAAEFNGIGEVEMLHKIYEAIEKSGIDLTNQIRAYMRSHNLDRCSTLAIVSYTPELQIVFSEIVNKALSNRL